MKNIELPLKDKVILLKEKGCLLLYRAGLNNHSCFYPNGTGYKHRKINNNTVMEYLLTDNNTVYVSVKIEMKEAFKLLKDKP